MQQKLILRNAVCLASVSPGAFDVDAFAARLELGAVEDKMILGDLSVTEWENARLQVLPDRLQLGFKEGADGDLMRRVLEDFAGRADELAPDAPIGFNAGLLLTLDDGDADPSEKLVNANALAKALGGRDGGRGGVTLVYEDELSRWWIELSPQPDRDRAWTYDFNRHFADFPDPGEDRDEIFAWFSEIEDNLLAQFETISAGVD